MKTIANDSIHLRRTGALPASTPRSHLSIPPGRKTTGFPVGEITAGGAVTECHNLADHGSTVLRPVGEAAFLGNGYGAPFSRIVRPDGFTDTIFADKQYTLRVLRGDTAESYSINLPSPPVCMAPLPDGSCILMLGSGYGYFRCGDDGHWSFSEVEDAVAPLALTSGSEGSLTHTCRGFRFAEPVSTGPLAQLAAQDLVRLRNHLKETYEELQRSLFTEGKAFQPRLGLYRMLDADGREIYRSCPVVLGSSAGLNCTSSFTGTLRPGEGGYIGMNSTQIRVSSYGVSLRVDNPASELLERAASVEVLLSPQIHPVDFSATPYALIKATSGTSAELSFCFPGAGSGSGTLPTSGASAIRAMLGRLSVALRPVARIGCERIRGVAAGTGIKVAPGEPVTVAEERTRLSTICRCRPDRIPEPGSLLEQVAAPHSFSARAVEVGGDRMLWADITPRLFRGFSPAEMAREVTVQPGDSIASVQIGSQRVVRSSSGLIAVPRRFSPLLCYPLSSATSITLMAATADGVSHRMVRQLESVPGCPYAFWLNPSLKPVALVEEGEPMVLVTQPPEVRNPTRFPGSLLSAHSQAPMAAVAHGVAGSAPVTRLMRAPRTLGGWSYSMPRFYAAASDGLYVAKLADSLSVSTEKVAQGSVISLFEAGAKVVAVTDDRMLEIDGAKCRAILSGVTSAGYLSGDHPRVFAMLSGEFRAYKPDFSSYHTREYVGGLRFINLGTRLYGIDSDGCLYDFSTLRTPGLQYIRYSACADAPCRHGSSAPMLLEAVCPASRVKVLMVSLFSGLGDFSAPLLRLEVDGQLRSAVVSPLTLNRQSCRTLMLEGEVSPDFRLISANIHV